MPQIFHPSSNTLARVSIHGAVFFLAALGMFALALVRAPYLTKVGVARDQPVPFSHKHHVEGLGVDCRYCHTSVENSSFAGLPPTKTCMNCHSGIWTEAPVLEPVRESARTDKPLEWTRVHNLADFVYFNHSIHVAKGVGCVSCHGQVNEMPLMSQAKTLHMDWCLSCHRAPENHVRPRDKVFDMHWQPQDQKALGQELVAEYNIKKRTNCSTCHR